MNRYRRESGAKIAYGAVPGLVGGGGAGAVGATAGAISSGVPEAPTTPREGKTPGGTPGAPVSKGGPTDKVSREARDPAASQSGEGPGRGRNPDLSKGGVRKALSPDDLKKAKPGRLYDEKEYARRPGDMAPSVQKGPQCAPTSIADAMRAQGKNVTARDVIDAGHRAAAKDPRLTPPDSEGWMTRETRAAAAKELGFVAKDVSFRTIEDLQALRAKGEVVVSVDTVRGGGHAMRVVSVEPSPPSVRNAIDPAQRTLGKVRLADTNPSRVPGQGGGRIVELSYEDFFQQTREGATPSDGYGMLICPATE